MDLRLALSVSGDTNVRACRVNEKFKDIPIPVRCQGAFDTAPAQLCNLDKKRLLDASKKALVNEGKRKLDEKLNKHLGDKNSKIKDAAKSLFNKLF